MKISLRNDRMVLSHDIRVPPELSMLSRARSFPICEDILRRIVEHNDDIEIGQSLHLVIRDIQMWQGALHITKSREDCSGDERLYPYQRVGVQWLAEAKRGILADDQGLGKTVMAASACSMIRFKPIQIGIVCNSSNISPWASHMGEYFMEGVEARDRLRGISVVVHVDGSRTLIVNYDNLSYLRSLNLDILIVDEAHHVRNRKTNAFRSIKGLAKRVEYLFLLTATPTVNADYDMWTLLSLCDPKRFSSYWSYIFRFFDVSQSTFGLKIDGVKESERDNLHNMVSPYMLHRDESVFDLPSRVGHVFSYHLPEDHRDIYNQMENEWVAALNGASVTASVKVAQITRLRQLAISPKLLFTDYRGYDKMDVLVSHVADGRPTVVFTAFEQAAILAAERIAKSGIPCGVLTGSTKNRDDVIQMFGVDFPVLIVTHGTGGESLTLTQAKRAIFLDLAWHPAGNRHAMKRIHRIGQDEPVEIIVIRSVGTIEEHIEAIIREKDKMSINELIKRMGR